MGGTAGDLVEKMREAREIGKLEQGENSAVGSRYVFCVVGSRYVFVLKHPFA